MTYNEAITLVEHAIYKKQKQIETFKDCIKYLKEEGKSNDALTQPPEKILENFGYDFSE